MSSPYPVLGNRPIDQWKVIELKEELKRRKLTTKGLKDDLIRRLDEALHNEKVTAEENNVSGFDTAPRAEIHSEDARIVSGPAEPAQDALGHADDTTEKVGSHVLQDGIDDSRPPLEKQKDPVVDMSGIDMTEKVDSDMLHDGVDDSRASLDKERDLVVDVCGTDSAGMEAKVVVQAASVETSTVITESVVSEITSSGQDLQNSEIQSQNGDSGIQLENEYSKSSNHITSLNSSDPYKPDSSDPNKQVSEVSPVLGFQVKSDSISTDSVSINEKIELKDNIIADDVKLELDAKHEVVLPSSNTVVPDDGKLDLMNVEEPQENNVPVEDLGLQNTESADMEKKNDSGDVGFMERLNLDRSSGEDSMEEDVLENKQIDSKLSSDEGEITVEKTIEVAVNKEVSFKDLGDDVPVDKKHFNAETKNGPAVPPLKRKLHDNETIGNNEITKKQRRWNSDGLKIPEPQSTNLLTSTTPKDGYQTTLKRNFSRSDSTINNESPKQRIVPPSSRPPTTSLRIDRFLRPFTLKAVQELLGKTGTVTSFWMDHIKTHCYVTYSSVEEAVETRNAVYDLKWPTNGGRHLVAEFVEPQEVRLRVKAPPPSPATPVTSGPTMLPAPPARYPSPSPRQHVERQQLPPPPSLPPPPPLSNPPPVRERLPPPQPILEKIDPPIVTLDDLFRKTKGMPRIYYLPLSEEQVAAKLKVQGKAVKQ